MSGALCIRYGRTLLLLCKKCGGTIRAPAPAFPALERPAALPPPAGSRPVPAAPTAGREIPVPQGLRFSAYRPAAFFCPDTRRKSRCFSPSAEFSRPHWKDGRAGVPDHDIGQRNFFCRHHALKPGYSREHHGRQRMRDGVHRGGMPARARTHQVDGIRRARHRILEKGMGQLCRGARKQDRVAARERRPFPIRFTTAVEP